MVPDSKDNQGQINAKSIDPQSTIEAATRAKWESLRPSFEAWAAQVGESSAEFDEIVEGQVEHARVTYQKERARTELEPNSALWDRITAEEATYLKQLLKGNPDEAALQRFLEANPKFLIQVLGGGHGRYQLAKQRLGKEYVPDFLIAEMSSIGIEWHAVEIESPRTKSHRNDGLASEALDHAVGQIRDWRKWLMNNIDYARRPQTEDGLGLVGIDARVTGLILIGRRHKYPERFNEIRRQMKDREHIVVHSYDWLVDAAQSNRSGSLTWELRENDVLFPYIDRK